MPISAFHADRGERSHTQVNQKMTSSRNASSGCFSGITRLLLCKGSLQTHPSDQITEPSPTEFDLVNINDPKSSEVEVQAPPANPGVVARLMGLDSLPDTNWVPQARSTPDSVTRSRSVNFMDYLLELDLKETQHRRVRTSVSFREVPTLLNQQNHDCFILYLDNNIEKTSKMGCKLRNSELRLGEMKQKNEEKSTKQEIIREGAVLKKEKNEGNNIRISKLKDEPTRVSHKQLSRFGSCKGAQVSSGFVSPRKKQVYRKSGETSRAKSPVKPINQKEALVESKFMKKMKNRQHAIKDLKPGCCTSEDSSSPVSVRGLSEFSNQDETLLSG